jgi:septum formation protein
VVSGTRIVLASRSPRRMEILRREGVPFESIEAPVDDPARPPEGDPSEVSASLARAKAFSVCEAHAARIGDAFVIGADTICAVDGRSIGKPESLDDARGMLRAMAGRDHEVVTSVAVRRGTTERVMTDLATVTLPPLHDLRLEDYLASGGWRGKAGAYDIEERCRAGWRIVCSGDPDTVGGLPWRLVREVLERWEP